MRYARETLHGYFCATTHKVDFKTIFTLYARETSPDWFLRYHAQSWFRAVSRYHARSNIRHRPIEKFPEAPTAATSSLQSQSASSSTGLTTYGRARLSGVSNNLEGYICPNPGYVCHRPSSMARPIRAVTHSQVIDESNPARGK